MKLLFLTTLLSISAALAAAEQADLTAPSLTATGANPAFTENGGAVDLFGAVAANTNDSGQTFSGLTLTISNVADGSNESLTIGGTAIPLITGSGTITGIGDYAVSAPGSVASVTLSGMTCDDTQMAALVAGIAYRSTSQDPGSFGRVVTITGITDSGASSNATATGIRSIVWVTPVNDPPTLGAIGGTPTFTEGGSAVGLFTNATISTVEAGQTIIRFVLTLGNLADGSSEILGADGLDIMLIDGASGTTVGNGMSYGVSVSGSTATVTLGKVAGLSEAIASTVIDSLSYRNSSAAPSTTSRQVTLTSITDSGGTSDGGVDTASLSITAVVTMVAVNNAPGITAPGSISVTEDLGSALTGIGFTDVDADGASETATLSVDSGTLAATNGGGVTAGGTGTSVLTLVGSLANLNAFIAGGNVAFTTASNATGDVTLSVAIDDGGNTGIDPGASGTGASEAAAAMVTLVVSAVNDPPLNTVPGAQTLLQDGSLTFAAGGGNRISVADVDAGGAALQVTLTATHGTMTLGGTSGLSLVVGSGTGDTTMTFSGTLVDLNAALEGAIYAPTSGYFGAATLEMTTNDLGNTGSGGAQATTDSIAITVTPIIPVVTTIGSPAADAAYKVGDALIVTVQFSAAVIVDTSGGMPVLQLETGTVDREAAYVSGSGTATLSFAYTVQAGDLSNDLDYASTTALILNGATIRAGNGLDAILTLPTVGGASSLGGQKALIIDGVAPTVIGVAAPADGTYVAGQSLDFTVTYDEAVVVASDGGTPRLILEVGGATRYATYVSGSGSASLTFRHRVLPGDLDGDGIALSAVIDLDGGTMQDAVGNSAGLVLNGIASTHGVLVDAVAPTAVSLIPVEASPTNHATLGYTLTFNEAVSGVDLGDLTLAVTGSVSGTLLGITPVDALTYAIQIGSVAGDGTLRVDLTTGGTGIIDAAGNALVDGLVGGIATIDTVAPVVTGATVPVAGSYATGQVLDFTVTFDEAVVVDMGGGSPRLTLDVGGTPRYAEYVSGSGSSTMIFHATVQAGDRDDDGIGLAGVIDAHGATLRDAAGNDAVLTLANAPSTSGVRVHTSDGDQFEWTKRRCGMGSGLAALMSMALFISILLRRRP